jgi:hypothetical protein
MPAAEPPAAPVRPRFDRAKPAERAEPEFKPALDPFPGHPLDPFPDRPAQPVAERPAAPESAEDILAQIMAEVTGSTGTGPPPADAPSAGSASAPHAPDSSASTTADRNVAPPWDPAPPAPSAPPWEPITEPPASAVSTWPTRGNTGPFAAQPQSPIPRAALERSDPLPVLRERPELRERPDQGERLDFGTGPQPEQRPERGSHRGGRHGKPGRRRRKDRGGDS